MGEERFFVIDVESIGLHGEGFAVAYVVIGTSGTISEEKLFACPPEKAKGSPDGLSWVQANVPELPQTAECPKDMRTQFWSHWLYWKARQVRLVADCGWPVEAKFLEACVGDDPQVRSWQGPYPMLDLASFLVAVGWDPTVERSRLADEPRHHPLGDARQSARVLVECLKALQARAEARQG